MTRPSEELAGIRKLYRFTRWLLEGNDPESLLPRLVEATREIADADEVILFQLSKEPEKLGEVVARQGSLKTEEESFSKTLIEEVIREGEPVLFNDVCEDPRFEQAQSIQSLAITSAVGAPLNVDGELMGVLFAARQRLARNFREGHQELIAVAASQAGLLMSRLASTRALRESESRYRSLVEMSPSAIAVVQEGKLVFANQTAGQLWGVDEVEALEGRRISELFNAWRSDELIEALRQGVGFESIDAWALRGDQADKAVEVVGRRVQFEGEEAIQLIVSMVGEKRNLLARRVRTDRLVMMGTMAATVGHEINNPLSYVYANLEYVVEELEHWWEGEGAEMPDGRSREDILAGLRSAREGTERIRSVVDGIQNFHRLDDDQERATLIEQPLRSSIQIARTKLNADVELQIDIRPTGPVAVSAARLGQVFLNLLVNGAQALEESEVEEKRLEVRTRQSSREVVIEIADTGPGIEEALQEDIFEPFVSTKEAEGTGLGLAICRDIVEAADGDLEVESERGGGCVFRVRLPQAEEMETQSFEVVTECPAGHQDGKILIVDPEPTLVRSLERILQKSHDVVAATTRGEALELLATEEFDVILCDLRLRGGLGRDLFGWVEENAPECWEKMVAMTANRITSTSRHDLEQLPNPWVTKPFEINRLRGIIDGILADGRGVKGEKRNRDSGS